MEGLIHRGAYFQNFTVLLEDMLHNQNLLSHQSPHYLSKVFHP